jgi:uncharacterized GH25 family protein
MKRWLTTLAVIALAAPLARAHFVFIVPDGSGNKAKVIFSDSLEPDSPKLLEKIKQTELTARSAAGKATPVKYTEGKDAFLATAPEGTVSLAGSCNYGVIQRGKAEPFLLQYFAKWYLPTGGEFVPDAAAERLPLEIVNEGAGKFLVLWQGKPLADAEVVAIVPGQEKTEELKTDKDGKVSLGLKADGTYALRAKHVVDKPGKVQDKEYKDARYYSTLVLTINRAAK